MSRNSIQKLLFVYGFFLLALCIINCVAYKSLIPPNPELKDQCVFRDEVFRIGELVTKSSTCHQLQCNEDGSLLVTGCARVRILHCNRGERLNTDKPYPACCIFRYKCKEADGTPYYIEKDTSKTEAT